MTGKDMDKNKEKEKGTATAAQDNAAAIHAALAKAVRTVLGTDSDARAMRLLDQVTATARARGGHAADNMEGLQALLISLRDLKPSDEVERMLVAQMIGVHEAMMECLRRAQLPDQTIAGRDMNLKHAAKLAQVYGRHVEVLDRHRGKGQQRITVEHVTVEAGGQAIVGEVHTGGKVQKPRGREEQGALPDDSAAEVLSREVLKQATPAKTRNRKASQ